MFVRAEPEPPTRGCRHTSEPVADRERDDADPEVLSVLSHWQVT